MMSKDETGPSGEDGAAFEASLADVVLRAFARGVDVERTWRIDPPVADAPGWQIAITRVASEKENGYDPSLIED